MKFQKHLGRIISPADEVVGRERVPVEWRNPALDEPQHCYVVRNQQDISRRGSLRTRGRHHTLASLGEHY